MSKYLCNFTNYLYGWVSVDCKLDPKNFLDCESEDDLVDCVTESLSECVDYGDINAKDSDYDCDIPKEFINEWKKLKALKNE